MASGTPRWRPAAAPLAVPTQCGQRRRIIGGGKPALPRDVRAELELVDERRFTDGVVYLRYRKPSESSEQ